MRKTVDPSIRARIRQLERYGIEAWHMIGNAQEHVSNQIARLPRGLPSTGPTSVQVLEPETKAKGGYNLNRNELDKIFYQVKDNPVVIISIAGAMREGKSFLLSLLVDYLENEHSTWLKDGNKDIPKHFKWKSGGTRETLGIYMWSKPYIIKKHDGTKVAVLLMDTQGAFDKDGSKSASQVFAFSTLLSSLQIYNIKGYINENHLQPLSTFTNYTAQALKSHNMGEENSSTTPLQSLLFVSRDSQFNEDQDDESFSCESFGLEAGQHYIKEVLSWKLNQPEEIRLVRENITKAFASVTCCMMPCPGEIVAGYKKSEGPPKIRDLDDEFKNTVEELFENILNPSTIEPKMSNNRALTGNDFLNLCDKYFQLLSNGSFDKPTTIIEMNAEVEALQLHKCLVDSYKMKMRKIINGCEYMSEEVFSDLHGQIKEQLMKEFDEKFSTPFTDIKDKYAKTLENEIEYESKSQKQSRHTKEVELREKYEGNIREKVKKYKDLLYDKTVRDFQQNSEQEINPEQEMYEIIQDFKMQMYKTSFYDEYEKRLREEMETCFDGYQKFVDEQKHLRGAEEHYAILVTKMRDKYVKLMDREVKNKCVLEVSLKKFHDEVKEKVLRKYDEKILEGAETYKNPPTKDKSDLARIMESQFEERQEINKEMLCQVERLGVLHQEQTKEAYVTYIREATSNVYVNPDALRSIHDRFEKELKNSHDNWVKEIRGEVKVHSEVLEPFKRDEIECIEEQLRELKKEMEERKKIFRESNKGAEMKSKVLIKILSIPAMVLSIVASPFIGVYALVKKIRKTNKE